MTGIGTALAIAGTGMQAISSIKQGQAANANAKFQAKQLEQRAKAERAVSQREAIESKRQIQLARSSAVAQGAGSGTALSSTTFTDILGGLDYEADLASRTELAAGENRAVGFETQASATKAQGKAAKTAGYMGAATAVGSFAAGSAGQSLFSKYGGSSVASAPKYQGLQWRGV